MTDRDSDRVRGDEDLTALVDELSTTLDALKDAVRTDARAGPSVPRRPRSRPARPYEPRP